MSNSRRPRKGRPPKTGAITLPFGGPENNPHTVRVDRHKPGFIKNMYNIYVKSVGLENTTASKFLKLIRQHTEVIAEEARMNSSRVERLWVETYK